MTFLPSDRNPLELKTEFAALLLRWPNDVFKAARLLCPDNIQHALYVTQAWPNDPYVKSEKIRLLDEDGPDAYLPTAYELAHDVYNLAVKSDTADDRLKAFRLYAEVRGIINKGGAASVVINNNPDNRQQVLLVSEVDKAAVRDRQKQLLIDMAEDAR